MGCNAWNHDPDCPCDFRGGHGYGGGGGGPRRRFFAVAVEPASGGWSRAHGDGTVASYINPNAKCPVCRAPVIFYRSPYDGRVFFDPSLGLPWPKHPCTDKQWLAHSGMAERQRFITSSGNVNIYRGCSPQ
jgi:hypothetical protein